MFGVGWICDVWDMLGLEAYLLLPRNVLFCSYLQFERLREPCFSGSVLVSPFSSPPCLSPPLPPEASFSPGATSCFLVKVCHE